MGQKSLQQTTTARMMTTIMMITMTMRAARMGMSEKGFLNGMEVMFVMRVAATKAIVHRRKAMMFYLKKSLMTMTLTMEAEYLFAEMLSCCGN